MRIPPQPTEFTSRPWWPLVVRIEGPGTSLGVASLAQHLRSQLGFAADVPVNIKLKSVRVWGPLTSFTAGPLEPLSVAIVDPVAENILLSGVITAAVRVLEQYTRYPDQVNRACCGYEYSLTHQSISFAAGTGTSDVQLLSLLGAGAGSVVYYYVLWRSGSVTPSAAEVVEESETTTDSEIEVVTRRTRRSLALKA